MHKRIAYMPLVVLATVLAGCVSDDAAAPQPAGTPVTVEAMLDGSDGTRSAMTVSDDFTAFSMWGFSGGSSLLTDDGGAPVSAAYTKSDGKWSSSKTFYWPTADGATSDFFGLSPQSAVSSLSVTASSQSFSYEVPTTNSAQQDLLVASELGKAKPADGRLMLDFHHALSMVRFHVRTTISDLQVTVRSISLCNLRTGGTFTFGTDNSTGTWGSYGSAVDSYTVERAEPLTLTAEPSAPSAFTENFADKDGVLMVLPQPLTKWDAATNVLSQTGNHVAVSCKVSTKGGTPLYYVGSASEWGTVYFPFGGFEMKMHQRYNFTLTMDGCRNADGSQVLQGVEVIPGLTVSVNSWNPSGSDDTLTM